MKIAVVHLLIDEVGGGERLMLHLVDALRSLGHSVDIYAYRVEQYAATPIVYRDGGGWTDIVSRISMSLGYARIEEAARIIKQLDGDPGLAEKLREKEREVVGEFSFENFRKGVASVVERLSREPRR